MSLSQIAIDNAVNTLINTYAGQSINYYGTGDNYAISPVRYFIDLLSNVPGAAPALALSEINVWSRTLPNELQAYFALEAFNIEKIYPRGSLLIWNTPHIAIVVSHDGSNTVQVFEQNADPDGSPCGVKNREIMVTDRQCIAVMVPITETTETQTYATPPQPIKPPLPPVTARPAQKLRLVTNVEVYKTELGARIKNRSDSAGMFPAGDYFLYENKRAVQSIAINNVSNNPVWYNIADNIVPKPEPVIEQPKPIKQPDIVMPQVMSPQVLLPSEVPISDDTDNAWKASYRSFNVDRSAVAYKVLVPIRMKEYSGKRPTVAIDAGKQVNMVGTFVKDGVTFYRPRANNDEHFSWYYGIPMQDDHGAANIIKIAEDIPQEYTLAHLWRLWSDDAKHYLKGKRVFDIFFRVNK